MPVFDSQPRNTNELTDVVCNDAQVVGTGNGGNQQIVWADEPACAFEICSDKAVLFGGTVVEIQASKRSEKRPQFLQAQRHLGAFSCPIQQLGLYETAEA